MTLSLEDEAGVESTPTYPEERLNKLTKGELITLATSLGVEGIKSSMLKADIVTAILKHLNG